MMNQLQALAMNEGVRRKTRLWSEQGRGELEKLSLAPWASRRRRELLELLDRIDPVIEELTTAAEREGRKRPEVARLMTHPGVGPLTALAFVLIIGTPERFQRGKQVGTYVGLIPSEDSSSDKQRLGHITKQGSCASCWWRRRRQQHGITCIGDVAMFAWLCVDTEALPRSRWDVAWEFGCTGCGETAVIIRRRWSSVRTRDSSNPSMV